MNRKTLIQNPTLADLSARMTPRQFAFSIAYVCKSTSIDAYREAYGTGSRDPSRQAYKVRHSPKVAEFIECAQQLFWENFRLEEERIRAEENRACFLRFLPPRLRAAEISAGEEKFLG